MIAAKPSTAHCRNTRIRQRIGRGALLAVALCALITARAKVAQGEWNGYEQRDFNVAGRGALLVIPKTPAEGNPWIWRTEFFGIAPQADIALLEKGLHVGYIGVGGLFGAPVALDAMDEYYDYVCKTYGLNARTVLEGFSRGGLYAFNWAARHPDLVACIYADAPVCDFKSWPGGGGRSRYSHREWMNVLNAYQMSNEEARAYPLNPIDNLKPLADAGIPILCVIGDMHDWIVPINENTLIVEERYKALGGDITVIRKPGAGHRPHSLPDPTPIVDFVLKHTTGEQMKAAKWTSITARKNLAIQQTIAMIPFDSKPDETNELQSFETPKNIGDLYGSRVRGFVHPPKSEEYVFAIASDDDSELFLSTNEDPGNKALIAYTRQPTERGNFNQFPTQKSKSVHLEGGKKYYIEAVHKENTGRDHLSVGWAAPGVSSGAVIPGTEISPYPAGEKGTIIHEIWLDPAGWPDRRDP